MDVNKKINKFFDEIYDPLTKCENNEKPSLAYLLDLFSEYNNDFHALDEIEQAYLFAKRLHAKSDHPRRESGEPYIIHPLCVAIILAKLHADKDTICAALLHDVIEDTGTTKNNIAQKFNENIANLVDGVSKLEYKDDGKHNKLDNLAYMRKLITESPNDIEIMLIKLADKLHNMSTIKYKSHKKQIETANETLELFVPFATIYGVYQIKDKLEDYSLEALDYTAYHVINQAVKNILIKRKKDVKSTLNDIYTFLISLGIDVEFKCSVKNVYSIYKMIEKEISEYNFVCANSFDAISDVEKMINELELHDLLSIQVIVDNKEKCYETNNIITNLYKVKHEETKDYISKPKTNMYQSLHTTIYDKSEKLLQIQIRTSEMDKLADCGVAALWDISGPYAKEDMRDKIKRNIQKPVHAIDRLCKNNEMFLANIKKEILDEDKKIVVYTPGNPEKDIGPEAIELPYGSTVIDFAYRIHTNYGDRLGFAVVNGKYQDPFYVLNDGDQVVLFKTIDEDLAERKWLNHSITIRSKKKIKECIKRNKDNEEYKEKRMHLV